MKICIITFLLLAFCCSSIYAGILENIAKPRDYETHRISSYDRTGGNADGGQANPLKVGETRTLAEITGTGEIAHIWFTFAPFDKDTLSNLILRMYWDGEDTPSVESPIGAFFGLGHGKEHSFDSIPFSVVNNRGINCFFPMPFNQSARITIENQSDQQLWALYYYVNYKKFDAPRDDMLYFHAQYRQEKPALADGNFVALEAEGRGHYVGQFYYIRANSGGWWGEGDDMIYIDGDEEPTLHGTGMEDYFGGAWGMEPGQSFGRFGSPLFEVYIGPNNENTAYRWHIEDAITFRESIRVTHEKGHANDRSDDFFSVSFWYQTHPRAPFPPFASKFERLSFADKRESLLADGKLDEYQALCEDFVDKAVEPGAAFDIRLEMAETYATNGRTAEAVDVLNSSLGPIPIEGWTARAHETAQRLSLDGIVVPTADLWIVRCDDGKPFVGEIGGSRCYHTNREHYSPNLYFKVQVDELRNTEQDLDLTIEFYDTGTGGVLVEFNSADDAYHRSELSAGEQGWRSVTIPLDSAKLIGAQHCGADLRMRNPEGDLYLRSISLSAR